MEVRSSQRRIPPAVRGLFSKLGPGLITGASDDDPSGIATYSQVGAQFGYTLLWTMLVSYPLMAAIQEVCGRIGRVTGCGLAANLRKNYPKPVLFSVLLLMSAANVFNLGADIGAMGASVALLLPGTGILFAVIFGVVSLLAVLFIPYTTYAKYLKWLTLSLFGPCRRGVSGPCPMAYCVDRNADTTHGAHPGIMGRVDCRLGNDHQSLSVLLAGFSGSRRGEEQSRRKGAETRARTSA